MQQEIILYYKISKKPAQEGKKILEKKSYGKGLKIMELLPQAPALQKQIMANIKKIHSFIRAVKDIRYKIYKIKLRRHHQ